LAGATDLERAQHAALCKPPIVLEADESAVLRALEAQMALATGVPVEADGVPV
jgi:hypothetical protein